MNDEACDDYALGKHHKSVVPKFNITRALDINELIHVDVCGQFKNASLGGSKYFLTFINDFSRKTWIYFMDKKSSTYEKFIVFKKLIENETRKPIKILQTDRGRELLSK